MVELQIVILAVAGSSPVGHPPSFSRFSDRDAAAGSYGHLAPAARNIDVSREVGEEESAAKNMRVVEARRFQRLERG